MAWRREAWLLLLSPGLLASNASNASEGACPENSTGANVTSGCSCDAGFEGAITSSASEPYYTGACVEVAEVACPTNSVGTSVASGCSCDAGYAGYISSSSSPPYYTGACVDVACPENSTGNNLADGCACNAGFNGSITAVAGAPFYTGSCLAVVEDDTDDVPDVPQSCDTYCKTVHNASSGTIIGGDWSTTSFTTCHVSTSVLCDTECDEQVSCERAEEGQFTDYGAGCFTGSKACCCGAGSKSLGDHIVDSLIGNDNMVNMAARQSCGLILAYAVASRWL